VTEKVSKVYNDVVFGGIAWASDESKICFVGEKAEPASYKNYWDAKKPDEQEEEKKAAADKKPEEDKKEEHYQDEKFLLNRDFGEMLVDKKNPEIFVFDLQKNTLNQV